MFFASENIVFDVVTLLTMRISSNDVITVITLILFQCFNSLNAEGIEDFRWEYLFTITQDIVYCKNHDWIIFLEIYGIYKIEIFKIYCIFLKEILFERFLCKFSVFRSFLDGVDWIDLAHTYYVSSNVIILVSYTEKKIWL